MKCKLTRTKPMDSKKRSEKEKWLGIKSFEECGRSGLVYIDQYAYKKAQLPPQPAVEESKKRFRFTATQRRANCYRRVSDDHKWRAPRSPHKLIQESHCHDPWRVLVICALLNLTTGEQVMNGVLPELFEKYPNAEAASHACKEDLVKLLRPLGLQTVKAHRIKKLSEEYLESNWTHVTQLYGVGKYAADAYAIFCVGKLEEVIPEDHKLRAYWRFLLKKRAREQQKQSVGDSS